MQYCKAMVEQRRVKWNLGSMNFLHGKPIGRGELRMLCLMNAIVRQANKEYP